MRDRSQLESETSGVERANDENGDAKGRPERRSRTGFNKRLLKSRNGEERCFEEARAHAGSFKLLVDSSTNINLLQFTNRTDQSSQMDLEDEDSIDISMSESVSINPMKNSTSSKQPFKLQRIGSKTEARRLFQLDGSFESGVNQTAISNASSTVNESDAVGVATKKEEETINTKLAMRELSMMFSSPAFGVDGTRKQNDQSLLASRINESVAECQVDTSFGNLGDGLMLDNSICNVADDENGGERNPFTRFSTSHDFEKTALRELQRDEIVDSGGARLDCRSEIGNGVRGVLQSDSLRDSEVDLDENPGFSIYEEKEDSLLLEDDDKKHAARKTGRDADTEDESQSKPDDHESINMNVIENGDTATLTDAIAILGGDHDIAIPTAESCEGDTATFSIFNEVFRDEMNDGQSSEKKGESTPSSGGFQIFVDDECDNVR
jgi:hypothetical protein